MSTLGKTQATGEIRKIKALAILRAKLTSGKTNAQLALEFNVSEKTIGRLSREAAQSGIVQHFEDQLMSDLVPAAVMAVKGALLDGDAHIALEILKGAGLLKKQVAHTHKQEEAGDSLELYIRAKRTGAAQTSLPSIAASALAPLSPIERLALTSGGKLPQAAPADSADLDESGVQDESEPTPLDFLDAELAEQPE